ncbi:LysE family transporter [Clostridium sp. Marseille-P2415]|uniref:LysE family transporter n=1 Tax=Clostridium sp. Marseille-P2415 TaxID=1805471 RepID=UPI0009888E50|nr:LysE family transporter [Clostridium sp. Marseille-P2415]
MPVSTLTALIAYMLINSFTPGPGNILTLTTITAYGWKRGKMLFFGIVCGYYCVQAICAAAIFGLSHYLSPILTIMKYFGAVYLLWLSIHIVRSRPDESGKAKEPLFCTGFLLQFVNVKIYFYGMTCLTGYVVPYYNSFAALLGTEMIIASVGSLASLLWAWFGMKIQKKYYKSINIIFAVFLIYCAWTMVF